MLCPRGPSLCGGRSLAGGQLQAIIRSGNCLFAFPPFEITWRNLWQNSETLSACVGSRRKGNRRHREPNTQRFEIWGPFDKPGYS